MRKLVIVILLVLSLMMVGGISAQLDYTRSPNYGSMTFQAGQSAVPLSVAVTAGGPVDVGALNLGTNCRGYATSAPDYRVQLLTPMTELRFYFVPNAAGQDTTLIVNTASGAWSCSDDAGGTLNPQVDFSNAQPGQYDIWVGTFASGQFISGTLYVTQNLSFGVTNPAPSSGGGLQINPNVILQVTIAPPVINPGMIPTIAPPVINPGIISTIAPPVINPGAIPTLPPPPPVINPGVLPTILPPAINLPNVMAPDYNLPRIYGDVTYVAAQSPIPLEVPVMAGGPLPIAGLGLAPGCNGHVTQAALLRVTLGPNSSGQIPTRIRFYFVPDQPGADATLLVNTATRTWMCSDDADGTLNPQISLEAPPPGAYDIWVGSFAPGMSIAGTLYYTENFGFGVTNPEPGGSSGGGSVPPLLVTLQIPPIQPMMTLPPLAITPQGPQGGGGLGPCPAVGSVTVNPFTPPLHGSVVFDPAPNGDSLIYTDVLAGGCNKIGPNSFNVTPDLACVGYYAGAPTLQVGWFSGGPNLRFYFVPVDPTSDATLLIYDPAGGVHCNDDSFGTLSPTVDIASPVNGMYTIWLGSYGPGSVSGALYIVTNDSTPVDPSD